MAELQTKIFSATATHTAALFYAKPIDVLMKGSAESIENQGSITFINYRGVCLGVTNEHVVEDYEGPSKDRVYLIALKNHQPLPGRLLFTSTQKNPDFSFDIAVFLLDQKTIVDGGKVPLEIEKHYGKISVGDTALAVGFPGIERRIKDALHMEHQIYHSIVTCGNSSDRKIILQETLSPPSDRIIRFGGMSGGPIFRVESKEDYVLSGIIFEGRGFHEDEKEPPGEDMWVWGFPLSPEQLDLAFDLFKPDLKLQPLRVSIRINPST